MPSHHSGVMPSTLLNPQSRRVTRKIPVGTSISRAGLSTSCAPLIAHAARVARLCFREYLVVLRDIDEASLHVAIRCMARSVQVLVCSLPKVTSFGPREQFLTCAWLLIQHGKPGREPL